MTSPSADGHVPQFEGRDVHAASIALSGSVDTGLILHDDDEVTLIVRGKVTQIGHKVDSFGVRRRVQSVKGAHVMSAAPEIIAAVEADMKRAADAESGQTSMDNDLDDGLDETALTDDEWEASMKEHLNG